MKTLLKFTTLPFDCGGGFIRPSFTGIVAQEDIDRMNASDGKIIAVPQYRPDGEKISEYLAYMTEKRRDAYEAKHGHNVMVHKCYLEGATFTRLIKQPLLETV